MAVEDSKYYRARAEKLRSIADGMRDPSAAETLRGIAANHDATANRLEATEKGAAQ